MQIRVGECVKEKPTGKAFLQQSWRLWNLKVRIRNESESATYLGGGWTIQKVQGGQRIIGKCHVVGGGRYSDWRRIVSGN